MDPALSEKVLRLSNFGWEVKSHTEKSVALSMRSPFSWLWFAFWFLCFLGFGAIMYFFWWLSTSKKSLFLSSQGGEVVTSGDTFYVTQQEARAEQVIRAKQEISEKGFFKAVLPSVLAFIVVLAVWFFIIWLLVEIFE